VQKRVDKNVGDQKCSQGENELGDFQTKTKKRIPRMPNAACRKPREVGIIFIRLSYDLWQGVLNGLETMNSAERINYR
jgi:hypothetical protein